MSFLQEDIAPIRAPISKKVEFFKWKTERFGKFRMNSTVKQKGKGKTNCDVKDVKLHLTVLVSDIQ